MVPYIGLKWNPVEQSDYLTRQKLFPVKTLKNIENWQNERRKKASIKKQEELQKKMRLMTLGSQRRKKCPTLT